MSTGGATTTNETTAPEISNLADDVGGLVDDQTVQFKEATQPNGEALASEQESLAGELSGGQGEAARATASPQSPTADAQPAAQDAMRQQARQLGFTDEDVQSLDAEGLQSLLEAQSRLLAYQANRQQMAPQPYLTPQQQWQPPPQPGVPGYGQQPPQQQPVPQVKVEFSGDAYDADFVQKMTELQSQYNTHLAAQQQQLQQMQQYLIRQQMQSEVERRRAMDQSDSAALESWIEQKGDAFVPLFGKGVLSDTSPQLRVRQALFEETRRLQMAAASAGQMVDPNWARETAARNVLGEKYTYFEQQAQRQPARQRQAQSIARANGMASRPASTGREAAARFADTWASKHGL